MGEPNEVQLGRGEFHENPFPCICKNSEASAAENISSQSWGSVSDELFSEDDELYSSELDYVEDGIQQSYIKDYGLFPKVVPSEEMMLD